MIIGIDEVGRGAWAGPLLFVAVGLGEVVVGLADSKKLTKKTREVLAGEIKQKANFVGYGWVTPSEVDDLGLTKASELACKRALVGAPNTERILIDGSINFLKDLPNTECIIDGDDKVPEISAASIVAKVERDNFMAEQALIYPAYGFENNVGYGTKKHSEAIKANGLTPIHRWSFKPIKEFLDNYEA